MTTMAASRNAEHVEAGRAALLTSSIHDADLGDARFDKVLAVHVPVFLRGDPARELAHLRGHLAGDGALHVVAQPFTADQAEPARDAITAAVERHGWTVRDVHMAPMAGTAAVCVVAGYG